jgi:hypothetical protein
MSDEAMSMGSFGNWSDETTNARIAQIMAEGTQAPAELIAASLPQSNHLRVGDAAPDAVVYRLPADGAGGGGAPSPPPPSSSSSSSSSSSGQTRLLDAMSPGRPCIINFGSYT